METIVNDKYATTIHFQQMYGKIPVEAYLVVSILPNGVIHSINGEYYPELKVDINPKVSAEKAKQIAFQHGQKHDPRLWDLPFVPDSLSPGLLIRPGEDKDNLLWHFTGQGGWEYYIDAQDETIHNAISPMRYSFQPGIGTTLSTKDLPSGAVVSFHLNDEPNPRFGECPMWPSQWDPNWGNLYLFEDDLSTGTSKVMVYDTSIDLQNRHQTAAHCEQCDIYSCCGSDPNCSCPVSGCCTCDTSC